MKPYIKYKKKGQFSFNKVKESSENFFRKKEMIENYCLNNVLSEHKPIDLIVFENKLQFQKFFLLFITLNNFSFVFVLN